MKWLPRAIHALPEVEPLTPMARPQPFDDPAFLFEPKYRGSRALLYVRGPGAWFQTTAGGIALGFEGLAWNVRKNLTEDILILDGVVIALDGDGKPDRHARLSGGSQLHYAAFDVLWRGRRDVRHRPLWWRKLALEQVIPRSGPILSRAYAVPEQGRALFRAAERLHYGGIVAKRRSDPYREGAVWYQVRVRRAV
jgi:bifunctional non-homologous end joining protein LigD